MKTTRSSKLGSDGFTPAVQPLTQGLIPSLLRGAFTTGVISDLTPTAARSGNFTIEQKVRIDDLANVNGTLVDIGIATGNSGLGVWIKAGGIVSAQAGNGGTLASAQPSILNGGTLLITVSLKKPENEIRLYFNNSLAAKATTPTLWASSANTGIGKLDGSMAWAPGGQQVQVTGLTFIAPTKIFIGTAV